MFICLELNKQIKGNVRVEETVKLNHVSTFLRRVSIFPTENNF